MESLLKDEKTQMQKVTDDFRTENESLQQQLNKQKHEVVSEQSNLLKLKDTIC